MLNKDIFSLFLRHLEKKAFCGEVRLNEPLSRHSTMGVGGAAAIMLLPKTFPDLEFIIPLLKKMELDYLVIGSGSNIIFNDGNFKKVFLKMKYLQNIEPTEKEEKIIVDAGASLSKVLSYCQKKGLSGLEFAAGVPSSFGGALVMNFGAFDRRICELVKTITILDKNGEIKKITKKEFGFFYRKSGLKPQQIILQGEIQMIKKKPEKIKENLQMFLKQRKKTQPLKSKSCGCIFKNPNGYFSGQLIEEGGCKGWRVGDALVSPQHANFIINVGKAAGKDIFLLAKSVQEKVYEKFNILLEPEVKFVGFNSSHFQPLPRRDGKS